MPRLGMNPARGQPSGYHPARLTLAMLTYLPNQAGYFEQRFAVTRLSLESLIENTPEPYDLIVFDNGSCPELVNYLCGLREQGQIQYLILSSRNIGKIGALQIIFRAAPGELIAYSDDDVLFLPGWLDAHLKLFEAYPRVGLVTGFYIRSHMRYGTQTLEAFAQRPDVQSERGFLIPRQLEEHYIENMGRTWETYQQEVDGLDDLRLTYQGVDALASAGHHQFLASRQVLLEVMPTEWSGQLMGKVRELEIAIDQLGYLRLSTCQPVTHLLGNIISPENAVEAQRMGLSAASGLVRQPSGGRLRQNPLVRRMALAVYNRLHAFINA
jgi:glycosyltransferase involved in cell wall biosynthesis